MVPIGAYATPPPPVSHKYFFVSSTIVDYVALQMIQENIFHANDVVVNGCNNELECLWEGFVHFSQGPVPAAPTLAVAGLAVVTILY